jgi:hypothetical protein
VFDDSKERIVNWLCQLECTEYSLDTTLRILHYELQKSLETMLILGLLDYSEMCENFVKGQCLKIKNL